MRLLYILHKFLPRYFSGTEIYTFSLAKEMQRRGHEVQVFCAENVEEGSTCLIRASDDTYQGIPVHRINFNRKKTPDVIRYAYANPLVADHLAEFFSHSRPGLVHITSLINVSAAVIDVARAFSVPTLFTSTDYWCFCPRSILLDHNLELCNAPEAKKCLACIVNLSPVYKKFFSKIGISQERTAELFPFAARMPGLKNNALLKGKEALEQRPAYLREKLELLDRVIAPNTFMRRLYREAGLAEEKVVLSGYGLNTDGLAEHRRNGPRKGPIRFAYMGMLGQLKGVDILIRSFRSLADSSQATLSIFGDRSHFPDYVAELKELAGDDLSICFEGTFPHNQLGDILAEIDVLVVPSLWYENAPLVIQSAFAAGIPVVGTNVAGITELVRDGVNGLLFPRGDEQGLAACLKRFIDEPRLLTELRENIEPVKTIEDNGEELEELYEKLTVS